MLSWHLPLENFCRVRSREPAFPVTWRTRRSGAKHAVDVCSWAMTHITTLQAWPNIADGQDLYPAELCKVGGESGRRTDAFAQAEKLTQASLTHLQRRPPSPSYRGVDPSGPQMDCRTGLVAHASGTGPGNKATPMSLDVAPRDHLGVEF